MVSKVIIPIEKIDVLEGPIDYNVDIPIRDVENDPVLLPIVLNDAELTTTDSSTGLFFV